MSGLVGKHPVYVMWYLRRHMQKNIESKKEIEESKVSDADIKGKLETSTQIDKKGEEKLILSCCVF